MSDFWIPAGVLLAIALVMLLIPAVRGRKVQAEEDRTALNVALYQERVAELEAQRAAGSLDEAQAEAGKAEAARELLDDTQSSSQAGHHLGRWLPVAAAFALPLAGVLLYQHWGALDRIQESRELAAAMPKSLEEMTAKLEKGVKLQPENPKGWYFLARSYMAENRPAEAAQAFAKTIELAGREPELLGFWAQARFFAEQNWTPELQALADEALAADPKEITTLGLLGIVAFEQKRYQDAIDYWSRVSDQLPTEDPSRAAILGGIERARSQLSSPEAVASTAKAAAKSELKVRVELAAALKDKVKPEDAVFISVRAETGPPMPLAAKRLTVAQLPAELTLSDSDALMPQRTISDAGKVVLTARISREGDALSAQWQGSSGAFDSHSTELHQVLIDQAVQP